uniref:Right handed beta helix domain-containing protein n=1 Tax=Schlesneria paludicola TaxID=360056 RepID=A0A7C4LJU3_9PLAN
MAQVGQVSPAPMPTSSGVATYDMENFSGGIGVNGLYFDIRHQALDGVGYRHGFTQFGGFVPLWLNENAFIAAQARLILTDDRSTGFNGGAVARLYAPDQDRIWGLNSFYDLDESQHGYNYQQIGFGWETLGERLDFRMNGYLPVTTNTNFITQTGLTNQLVFFEHRLGFIGTELVERALAGGDFEVGTPLLPTTPWLRGFAGMYFYDPPDDGLSSEDIIGFRGRIEGWISDDLSVGVIVTTDTAFGTNVNAVADWRFAGFKPTRYWPQWRTSERMMMPVQRHWRVTVHEYERNTNVVGYNPRDDQPYFVVWVDNSNPAPGDGTYENPYRNPPVLLPNETDLVLVRRGNTTALAPLSGSIVLPNYARLLGEGYEHVVDAYATFGSFSVAVDNAPLPDPAFTNTGRYPFLTAPLDIVRVRDHNEVAAFVLQDAGGAAIRGSDNFGFHLHHLEVTNNAGGGIVLNGARGTGLVTVDGQIINSGLITNINTNAVVGWVNPLGLGNNGPNGGISILTGLAPLDLTIADTAMNATPGGQDYGVRLRTALGGLNVTLSDVQASGGNVVAGISLEQGVGRIDAAMSDITTTSNGGNGIQVLGGGLPVNVVGDTINSSNNTGHNLFVSNTGPGTVNVGMSNALFNNSVTGSGVAVNSSGGTTLLTLDGAWALGNAQNGVNALVTAGSFTLDAANLFANGNTGDNLLVTNAGATVVVDLFRSQFNGSATGSGVVLDTSLGGTSTLTVDNITASNNAFQGLRLLNNTGTLNFTGSRIVANGNQDNNLYLQSTSSSFAVNVTNSQFNNSVAGSGIVLAADAGTGVMNLSNINANTNAAYGIQVSAVNGSIIGTSGNGIFDGVNVVDSNLYGNGIDASNVFADGASYLEFFVDPSNLSSSGRHGFRFEVRNGSTLVAAFEDINLNFSGSNPAQLETSAVGGLGRGVFGLVDGAGSSATVSLLRTTMDRAGDDGLYVGGTNSGVANVTVTDSRLVDAGQAIGGASSAEISATSGAAVNLVVANSPGGNTAPGGSADFGLSAAADGAGSVATAIVTNSNFNNAAVSAVNASAANAGVVTVDLTAVTGTNAGGPGILAQADAGVLNLELSQTDFSGAGIHGLLGTGVNGATFNACIEDTVFDGAAFAGVLLVMSDAGTEGNVHIENSSASGNGAQGLNALVENGAQLNLRTVGSAFDNNGADGVLVTASDAGTIARLLFSTTSADSNALNGYHFVADNGATMTARIDNISAQNNGQYGVRLDANDPGTAAILLPSGNNVVLNNGLGSYSINYNNVAFAILNLNGSFNGQAGDGVSVNINNSGTVLITLTGDGTDTIDSNAGDGVDLRVSNANTVGILIDGYQSISSNLEDGVHIELSNISTAAAVELRGPTNVFSNGDDGVEILLNQVALGTFVPPAGLNPLSILTLTDNDPNNACLPEPVSVPFNSLVTAPSANGILVDQYNIAPAGAPPAAGQDGIVVAGSTVTGTGTIDLTNNTVTGFQNGINVYLNPSSIGGLTVSGNTISNSTDFGVAVVGVNTSFNQVDISNNVVSNTQNFDGILAAFNGGGYTNFVADGNTVNGSGRAGVNLLTVGAITGDATISNTVVSNSGHRGVNAEFFFGSVNSVALLNVSSNGSNDDALHVGLTNLAGLASVLVDGQGTAQALNAGGDGIDVVLSNVAGTPDLAINGYNLVQNVGGNGIVLSATSTNVDQVDFIGNTVNLAGLDGVRLVLDGTVGDGIPVGLNFNWDILAQNNVVSNTGGDSFDYLLDNMQGFPDIKFDGNTVSNFGPGEQGYDFSVNGAQLGAINFDPLLITGNFGAEGIRLNLQNTALSDGIVIDQVTVTGSLASGILVKLTNVTGNTDLTMTGPSTVQGSSGSGIFIEYINVAGTPDISIDGYTVRNNAGGGIVLYNTATPLGNVSITNSTILNSAGGDGIQAYLTGAINQILFDNLQITNSSASGVNLFLSNVTGTPNVTISDTDVTTSGFYGVALYGSGNALNNVVVDNVSATGSNAGDGILVGLSNGSLSSVLINDADTLNSAFHGVNVALTNISGLNSVAVTSTGPGPSTVQNSVATGIQVALNGTVTGTPNITVDGYNVSNSSTGSGIGVFNNGNAVGAVTISNNNVTNSLGGDGIQAYLSGAVGSVALGNNSITNSSASGVNLFLSNVVGNPNVSLNNTTVSGSGFYGIAVYGNNDNLNNVLINNSNVVNSSFGDGVLLRFTNSDVQTAVVDNANVNVSAFHGVNLALTNVTGLSTAAVTSTGPGPSTVQNSVATGIRVLLNGTVTGTPNITVDGYNVSNSSTGSGIGVFNNGNAVGAVTISNNNVTNSLGGDGIQAYLSGSVGSVLVTNDTVNNSSASGVNLFLSNIAGAPDVTVSNSTISNNAFFGVAVYSNGTANVLDDILVSNVSTSFSNGGDGIFVGNFNNSTIDTVRVVGSSTANSARNGIHLSLAGITGLTLADVSGPGTVNLSGRDGILVNLNNPASPATTVNVSGMTVNNSTLRGIAVANNGQSIGNVTISNNNVSASGSDGIQAVLSGPIGTVTAANDVVSGSGRTGLQLALSGATGGNDVTVSNAQISNSTDYGLVVAGNAAQLGDILVTGATVTNSNGFDGILVSFNNSSLNNSVIVENANVTNSALRGIHVNLNATSGVNLVSVDPGTVTNSGSDGILVHLLNVLGVPDVVVDGYTVNNSGGRGIAVITNNVNVSDVTVQNNIVNDSLGGNGILVDLDAAVLHFADSVTVNNNVVDNSANNGVEVGLNNVIGTTQVTVSNTTVTDSNGYGILVLGNAAQLGNVTFANSSAGNSATADGVRLELTNSSINNTILFNNVSSTGNTGTGINVLLSSITSLNNITFTGIPGTTLVSGNTADGISFLLNNNPAITPALSVSNYTVSNNNDDGIFLSQTGSPVGPVNFTGNVINANGANGVNFLVTASSQGTVTFTQNNIFSNTVDGVRVVQPQDTDGSLDFVFLRNRINGNTQRGVNFTLPHPTGLNDILNASFTNDSITNNGQEGVNVALNALATSNVTANVSVLSDSVTANPLTGLFNSNFSGNGRMGLYLLGNSTSDFVLNIGGTGDANTFNGNGDAGVGIQLSQNATATATVSNASFNGNSDAAVDLNPFFEGDGFRVVAGNNSQFTNSTFGDVLLVNTTFSNNARHGFSVAANNFAVVNNVLLQNASFQNNTGDGLNFIRTADASITNVTITDNLITGNSDGIDAEARSRDAFDTYLITDNRIEANNANGIRFFTEFDADIGVVITGNLILSNAQDGINARENADVTDNNGLVATVNFNDISFNGSDGIDIITKYTFNIDQNNISDNEGRGVSLAFLGQGSQFITTNTIERNGLDGIAVNSAFAFTPFTIDNNDIVDNGRNGIQFASTGIVFLDVTRNLVLRSGNDGMQLEHTGGGMIATVGGTLANANDVLFSGGDAMQIFMHGDAVGASNLTVSFNQLSDSDRRGINVVNAGESATSGARTQLTVNQNVIERNDFEGIYVINTTAQAQGSPANIDRNANLALLTSTDARIDPRLALNVTNNIIQSNGENGVAGNFISQLTSGLVLRIGTSDANTLADDGAAQSYQNDGGFATNLTAGTFTGNVAIGNLVRGGVGANISNNTFSGQFGADITFQPFRSVETLATTGTRWDDNNNNPRDPADDVFNITSFIQDPLARFDLRMVGNTGDGAIVTRSDAGISYNNSEPIFKSRVASGAGSDGNDPPGNPSGPGTVGDDNGPFTSGTRNRNATRLASNTGAFNRPTGVGTIVDVSANGFLYPGVGGSTFRRTTTSTTGGFTTVPAGSDFGDNVPIGGAIGELPFIWATIP